MHFSIESNLRAENISEAFVNGRCTIRSEQTRLNVIVRVQKGTNGSPLINVHECRVNTTAPYVIACGELLPVNMSSFVQVRFCQQFFELFCDFFFQRWITVVIFMCLCTSLYLLVRIFKSRKWKALRMKFSVYIVDHVVMSSGYEIYDVIRYKLF